MLIPLSKTKTKKTAQEHQGLLDWKVVTTQDFYRVWRLHMMYIIMNVYIRNFYFIFSIHGFLLCFLNI